jgi:hypothetical protein
MSAKKVMGNILKLPAFRLSFSIPDLFVAQVFEDGDDMSKAKFGCSFLGDPKKPKHAKAIAAVAAEEARMIHEAWGTAPKGLILEYCGNGNDRTNQQTGQIYGGYEDMWFISCKNKNQPLVIDDQQVEIASNDKRAVAGMYANATINLFCQENKFGRAIRASVRAVQVLGYGEPFGSSASAKEFDDFDTDDEGLAMREYANADDDGL